MPSLVSGNSVSIVLDGQDFVTVTNADVYHPTGKTAVTTETVFGPYSGGGVVRIVSTGSCTYTVSDVAIPTPSSGASDNDILTIDGTVTTTLNLAAANHANRLLKVTGGAPVFTFQSDANGGNVRRDLYLFHNAGAGTITVQSGAGATVSDGAGGASFVVPAGAYASAACDLADTLTLTSIELPRPATNAEAQAGTSTVLAMTPAATAAAIAARAGGGQMAMGGFGMCVPQLLGSTGINALGAAQGNTLDGSALASTAALADGGQSVYGWRIRVRVTAAAAAVNRSAGANGTHAVVTGASGGGGFPVTVARGVADANAACSFLMGLVGTNAFTTSMNAAEPSAVAHQMLCAGWDSTDANVSFMRRANTGSVTKEDLGASWPKSQWVAYILRVEKATGGGYTLTLTNGNTGASISRTYTTSVPLDNSAMYVIGARSSMAVAAAVSVDHIADVYGV